MHTFSSLVEISWDLNCFAVLAKSYFLSSVPTSNNAVPAHARIIRPQYDLSGLWTGLQPVLPDRGNEEVGDFASSTVPYVARWLEFRRMTGSKGCDAAPHLQFTTDLCPTWLRQCLERARFECASRPRL